MLFLIQILPALFYALYKENRFTRRSAMAVYGLLAVTFGITLSYNPLADANVRGAILLFYLVGFVWLLVAFYRKGAQHVIFSYKSIAAFEIPVVLYIYQVLLTQWDWVFPSGIVLFFLFHLISWKSRKEDSDKDL